MHGKLLIDMVNCRAMGDARLAIQTKLGPQKDNSETFVIFAAFCVNPLSSSGRVLQRKGNNISTEDHKDHKGKTGLSVHGKLLIGMVNCRAMSDARLAIQTKLGPQKDNSETFVIIAAFCANPRFKSFNSNEAILTRIVDTAFILPRGD